MKVLIERQTKEEGGGFVAYTPNYSNPVVYGYGATISEAKTDFCNTRKELIEFYDTEGVKAPRGLLSAPEFKMSVKSLFEAFPWINASAVGRALGINDSLMRQYKRGSAYVSEERLAAIEAGIHALGAELCAVSLR